MSLFSKIGHALKGVAEVALPVVGSIVGGPVGGILGKVGAGLLGSSGASNAAGAIGTGNQNAQNTLSNFYTGAQQQLQPYQQAGTNALTQLNAVNTGDYSGFQNSPDYQYALQQGQQAINRQNAATGGRLSGNSLLALNANAQGLASQNLGNYTNRLMGLAGIGQNATNTLVGTGGNVASQIGSYQANTGNANSSGIVGSTNAWGNVLDGIVNGNSTGGTSLADLVKKYSSGNQPFTNPALMQSQMPTGSSALPYLYGSPVQ